MASTYNQLKNKSFSLWPYAIVTAIVLFMSYIIYFVVQAMGQDVDLVSTNYYQQEIAYQEHMDKVGRTKATGDVQLNYNAEAQNILLQLPAGFKSKRVNGNISFFRPSDDALDFDVQLQLGRDMSQLVSAEEMKSGLWKVRVNFTADTETYFTEKTILIQ
ncbi:FixH family protein [Pontibacter silvestris]